MPKDTATMPAFESSTPAHSGPARMEGITVIGEAVRRVHPESAEFTIEIGASAGGAAQALRDARVKTDHVAQALAALGVQASDLQTVSIHVYNLYSPTPALMGYGGIPQMAPLSPMGPAGLPPIANGAAIQPDVQYGTYHARTTLRINVRDPSRVGEVVDAATRAGGLLVGNFAFKVGDEAQARRAALEAAGRDARAKAESLAAAAGKQVGDPVAISEDVVASNGAYAALRTAFPLAFGMSAPQCTGELEYYARVSAAFRLQ